MARLHLERHRSQHIGWLRAAVLGANDGVISTASLIVGVAAAQPSRQDILIAGLAGLAAGAMSMAAGEFVSVSSQADTERADIARETRELAEDPDAEHRGCQFGTYLAPSMQDLPEIESLILENPSHDGPFGAKAIGEMANNAQPPAISAAVYDAVGVWITDMPITPEKVLRALDEKAAGKEEFRRVGKRVIFDEEIAINAVGKGHVKLEAPA